MVDVANRLRTAKTRECCRLQVPQRTMRCSCCGGSLFFRTLLLPLGFFFSELVGYIFASHSRCEFRWVRGGPIRGRSLLDRDTTKHRTQVVGVATPSLAQVKTKLLGFVQFEACFAKSNVFRGLSCRNAIFGDRGVRWPMVPIVCAW